MNWIQIAHPTPRLFLSALTTLKASLQKWSRHTFEVIPKEIGRLRKQIIDLERDGGPTTQLTSYYRKLQELTVAEGDYWQQRSRSNWLQNGDRNTSYFHHHASYRRKRNCITKIKNANDVFVTSSKDI